MTKQEIVDIARAQLALDMSLCQSPFERDVEITENIPVHGRRMYKRQPDFFHAVSFLGKAAVSADKAFLPWCVEKMQKSDPAWIFEYSMLRQIDAELLKHGVQLDQVHLYYLPEPEQECFKPTFQTAWFEEPEMGRFSNDERFGEALAFEESHPDMLALAAVDNGSIMGMAGASADSGAMWQIGIDVMPQYRGRGVGAQLVRALKNEVLNRGKVPFYGTAVSHILSQNVAHNAGFFAAWCEIGSKATQSTLGR